MQVETRMLPVLATWLLLLALAGAGCRDRGTRREAEARAAARQHEIDATYARFGTRLRRHERATLVPFSSETDLRQYLDMIAALLPTRQSDRPSADAPHPLKPLPDRMHRLDPGPNMDLIGYHAMVGLLSDASPEDGLPRFVRRAGRVYLLYANRLRSFDVDAQTGTLRPRAELTLGPPLPERMVRKARREDGATLYVPHYDAAALAGVAIFDAIFAIDGALVALGTRQDRHAVEVVRIAVGPEGDLRETDAHAIYYLPPEAGGYHAQVVDGALSLQLEHRAFEGDWSSGHAEYFYTLPALAARDSGAPLRSLLRAQDVYQPLVHAYDTVLHIWLRCDLTAPQLTCRARAIPGPPAAAVHAGEDAFYTWLAAGIRDSTERADGVILRVPFDGGAAGAVRVRGAPPSQMERPLHVEGKHLSAIIGKTAAELTLLRVPLETFSPQAPEPPARHYRSVKTREDARLGADGARFVGRHLLWGSKGEPVGYHLRYPPSSPSLELISLHSSAASSVLTRHSASFVYGLEDHALVIGSDGWHLHYSLIALADANPHIVAKYVLRDAVPKLARHGSATMISSGGEHWFIADVTPLEEDGSARAETRLPLSWSKRTGTLVPAPLLRAPEVPRSPFQPVGSELLALDERRIALRMQDQLLVYDFTPQPALRQRIPLSP